MGFSSPAPRVNNKKGPLWGPFLLLAGGEGFEPPLTESESVVLPLDDPPIPESRNGAIANSRNAPEIDLALRVLRRAASFAETDFLALDLTGIARNEACTAQIRSQ